MIKSLECWTRACKDSPEFVKTLVTVGFTPKFVPAAQYASILRADIAFWRHWIERLGISQ